jgi:glutathione synthase/RimK-type ligase-like ATP-grasp enzyme
LTGPASEDDGATMFTTALTTDELEQLDGLDLCPMIFQERVENRQDVRVTVAGPHLVAAAAAPGGAEPDWRRASYARDRAPVWTTHHLPDDVARGVRRLVDELGLRFAALDFIVRPDGRHVFLELNASGSFAYLGAPHATEIAAGLARTLLGETS